MKAPTWVRLAGIALVCLPLSHALATASLPSQNTNGDIKNDSNAGIKEGLKAKKTAKPPVRNSLEEEVRRDRIFEVRCGKSPKLSKAEANERDAYQEMIEDPEHWLVDTANALQSSQVIVEVCEDLNDFKSRIETKGCYDDQGNALSHKTAFENCRDWRNVFKDEGIKWERRL